MAMSQTTSGSIRMLRFACALIGVALAASCGGGSNPAGPGNNNTGPATWVWENPRPQGNALNAVAVFGAGVNYTIMAVGDYGTIVRWAGRGADVEVLPSGTDQTLRGVELSDADHAIVVGDMGTLLRTSDGGVTWEALPGQSTSLRGIDFVGTDVGVVVGGAATSLVLRTTDGGDTWTEQQGNTSEVLNAVHFTDADKGTAVGRGGAIIRTVDGGTTWTTQNSGASLELMDIAFASANVAAAVGAGGTLLYTTDAGASWSPKNVGTTQAIQGSIEDNVARPRSLTNVNRMTTPIRINPT